MLFLQGQIIIHENKKVIELKQHLDPKEQKIARSDRPIVDLQHAQLRATMVWNLSAALSIWYRGSRPTLTQEQAEQSAEFGRNHLRTYALLALKAAESERLLYKLRPKHHYMEHLLDEVERLHRNPMAQSNFLDEDNMKVLKGVSLACHPRTVKTTWARRYILKKTTLWFKIAKSPRPAT